MGTVPTKCQTCAQPIDKVFYDARTKFGPWANICESCFEKHGMGLGIGKGQKYELKGDKWRQTAGGGQA